MKVTFDSLKKTSEESSSGIAQARASLVEFTETRKKTSDSLSSTYSYLL
jgi:hypothetical protein